MNGLVLSLIANKLFPTNSTISSFAKENAQRTINRIDSILCQIENDSLIDNFNDNEINVLIGSELRNELSKGDYGKPVPNVNDSIRNYIKNVDVEILKLYILNSWQYIELKELLDE